ncbi:MAG: bifunctional 5,10-methylenetetrahydrofolate dehydrogenase/5,10-methenyltetrahydrofolate cyclohydrolase [Candidatus Saccharimonadales bacterium]
MKLLNGRELADYIKERQARQVRALRQARHIAPKLAIIQTGDNPVIDSYVMLKQQYGADILVDVEVYKIDQAQVLGVIERLNHDDSVHGVIVQLPLADTSETDRVVNSVAPHKDVDGLGDAAIFDPATPLAIEWLIAGYNISLVGQKVALVGNGRLVGKPLASLWKQQGVDVTVFDAETTDMHQRLPDYDVIVTATGVPRLISSTDVKLGAVVIDAGTTAEHGTIIGDVADDVRHRDDIKITPTKGGVGPLTVTALFDNVLRAASASD